MNQGMKQLARRLETEPAVLVTILESKGSAPRHAGAFMAVLASANSSGVQSLLIDIFSLLHRQL